MSKVALIIIYNHQYNKNIDILESIYRRRFDHIFHLVPFYQGEQENVIAVHENSYYFQGYIAQGFKFFYQEKFDHYFFIGDDLLLNPVLNQENYSEYLTLDKNSCFFPEIFSLHNGNCFWQRLKQAYEYRINCPGVEIADKLPDPEYVIERFKDYGLEIHPLKFDQVVPPVSLPRSSVLNEWWNFFRYKYNRRKNKNKPFPLSYPIVGGYSDIFIINKSCIKTFSHYCGLFAASHLFVELAIPTSMLLSTTKLVNEKEARLKGCPLWTTKDFKILEKYNMNLTTLQKNFPEGLLYLHPIKLSKWQVN